MVSTFLNSVAIRTFFSASVTGTSGPISQVGLNPGLDRA